MKKLIAWMLLLLLAALLCACAELTPSDAPADAPDDSPSAAEPDTSTVIAGISFSEGLDYADALEFFWSDEEYWYVFPAEMSEDCTVTYADGTSENIVDALENGRVTVEDLEAYALP